MDRTELVARLIARDEGAWRSFLEQEGRLVYAVAARHGLSGEEREDLLQSTCLSVLRRAHTLRDPERLSSWVYSIAWRSAIDLRRRRPSAVTLEEAALPAPEGPLDSGPLAELERLHDVARLFDALAKLDLRCRMLLRALYFEDPPVRYADLARRERIPIGSIGPTRARCLARLEIALSGLSNGPPAASTEEKTGAGKGRPRKRSK